MQELEKFLQLIQDAKTYKEALILREYVSAVEERTNNSDDITEGLKNWLNWARMKIDWYDPLINLSDSYFDDVDKQTLAFKKKSYF